MKLGRLIKICLNETCSKVHIGKHLSDIFPIQNGLKQGNALSPLLFNFALEYANRKVQENQVGLKLNGLHQLLAYADIENLLRNNINPVRKNIETFIDASKEVGLEINVEKTKFMFLSRRMTVQQNRDINITNSSFENVSQFRYFRMAVTNQNFILKQIKRPPLWSSGQSSWLQIQRPRFDSWHYQKKKSSGSGTGSTQPREYN
jgi:hypothetical protein